MGLIRTTSHATGARPHTVRDNPKVRLPTHRLSDRGLGGEFAQEAIASELLLDGSARLNLATFVTTWMPERAEQLMAQTADKNMIDKDEYPQTAAIEARCVNIIADLWNAPDCDQATGCSTTGSSEAVMLGALALKWRWRERLRRRPPERPAEPRHRRERPGLLGEVLPLLGRRATARPDGG